MQRFRKVAKVDLISKENTNCIRKVNLCLDEKQDKVLKPPQLSCTGGNSARWVEGRRRRAWQWSPKLHWGPQTC